ncbi:MULTISPECIES: DUF3822 family protein [Myroides]|uniref:DUF3822 family protein n=1 Tax=Myroides albus TaxID=2562892 RepID=A0A6I3LJZ4_9FLAO|nr:MULTISPECIES: DUF3822 family protein [Myroides]MTG98603.1 DUF3822 family protein [Myroides albus]MVX35873.1 DUF3822 family protein [Myroides sp. LoEW2-1]UVD79973.1 DUF3822 family protein [Myroides albus]
MARNNQKLVIQASLNKFSFVIKNLLSHEITYFASEAITHKKSFEEQLERFFEKYDQLSEKYDEVLVLHDSTLNTFVPKSLFKEELMGAYLQYNTKVFTTDFFAFDEVSNYDFNNVYIPFIDLNNFLLDKYGTFTYQNINTGLVQLLLPKSKKETTTAVYTYLKKDRFEIVVAKNNKLLLFNSFQYNSPEDFIYYVLFTYEQLNLDPNLIPIYLLGRVDQDDHVYQQAYTFIKEVHVINEHAFIAEGLLLHYQVPKQHYILFHS